MYVQGSGTALIQYSSRFTDEWTVALRLYPWPGGPDEGSPREAGSSYTTVPVYVNAVHEYGYRMMEILVATDTPY
jgi:hypothetical protein